MHATAWLAGSRAGQVLLLKPAHLDSCSAGRHSLLCQACKDPGVNAAVQPRQQQQCGSHWRVPSVRGGGSSGSLAGQVAAAGQLLIAWPVTGLSSKHNQAGGASGDQGSCHTAHRMEKEHCISPIHMIQ
jgi:hypothetical protein